MIHKPVSPVLALLLLLEGLRTSVPAAEEARAAARFPREGERDLLRGAIDRGLGFLAGQQLPSGAMSRKYPVAITGLSGLAFLGAGHHVQGGTYARVLKKSLKYLQSESEKGSGYIGDPHSRMHGHCYAVLFLTQASGEIAPENQADVARMIRLGVDVIVGSQTSAGGWHYLPENTTQDEASLTICALQSLRAAREIGFQVPKSTVDRAVAYVMKCQAPDGSFQYSLTLGDRHTSYGLTVAALSTLHAAGIYDNSGACIKKGFDFARKSLGMFPGEPLNAAEKEFFFYANLYAAQAYWQAGGELWAQWRKAAEPHLLARQAEDGSWSDDFGEECATAMALLILEVPLGYLPIFQR